MESMGTGQNPETPAIVGVVGRSGSGKTSLLERLISTLASRGLAVGAVKHTSHGFRADRPGKDSHRLYESGAAAVALISAEQLAIFARRRGREGEDVSLAAALQSLPQGLELVLVEGFSWEPIPRILVLPGSEAPLPGHSECGEVLQIVQSDPQPQGGKPSYSQDLIDALADLLIARVRPGGVVRPAGGEAGDAEDERG